MTDKIELREDLVTFLCPGCGMQHHIMIGEGPGPRWGYNGNKVLPTFTPSILVRTGHYAPAWNPPSCWCTYRQEHPEADSDLICVTCHSFITDGMIQFLDDCTHPLAGQTVPLLPAPDRNED